MDLLFDRVKFFHGPAGAFGSAVGVRDLNVIIEPGSIVGVTRPSGAGKTTFADLLVGLYSSIRRTLERSWWTVSHCADIRDGLAKLGELCRPRSVSVPRHNPAQFVEGQS